MDQPQIVVSGSIALDRIMTFSGHFKELIEPAKLHVLSVSVLVDTAETAHGGIGANISYNLAFLGEKPVLLAAAGSDANEYIKMLDSTGIDTNHIYISKLGTASFNVLNDSEGNQVGGFYPGAMSDASSLSFKPWANKAKLFWIAPQDPTGMRQLNQECIDLGLKYGYDPGQQVTNLSPEDMKLGAESAEIFMINEYELEVFTKKTGLTKQDLQKTVPILITTKGVNGSEISGTSVPDPIFISRANADKVVDPGGAGDSYRGGFLYGYLRQWDLRKSGQLGAVLASFTVEQHGPQAKFDKQAIINRYKETFKEEIDI